jgi:hypothetical protein
LLTSGSAALRRGRASTAGHNHHRNGSVHTVCAVLAHTRGTARLRDLITLVEAVHAIGGKRAGELLQ